MSYRFLPSSVLLCALLFSGCGSNAKEWQCTADVADPDELAQLGCQSDFSALSSEPLNASIPGARSVKTIVDRVDGNRLHFQNSRKYPVHYDFASLHLSGGELPVVPLLSSFNQTEYFSPDRRFLLGALTYYEGPGVWTYEISPYDTASAQMIETTYDLIVANSYFGSDLYFHPTSEQVSAEAANLSEHVKVISTDELFAGIDYQPLNLGESMGRLVFMRASELEAGSLVSYRDIGVLDQVPNDIAVVAGLITGAFQTPLSHVNVLSQNRGTPNMALRGAYDDPDLNALAGKWVRLTVGAFSFTVEEVTEAEAEAWWEANRPAPITIPQPDYSVTELADVETILDIEGLGLGPALQAVIPAFGGKASNYAGIAGIEGLPVPKAFAIPLYYYNQFMVQNGFDVQVANMLADPDFRNDAQVRLAQLEALRAAMVAAPVDTDFETALLAKLAADYPGLRMRFRSSTNAEDLDGFTGAGLYTSRSGDPTDPTRPVLDAIRSVWASTWNYRAFDEREYRGINHEAVGMALLVHNSFPDEEANGVAVTANLFDPAGLEPGLYVNVQKGEASVVQPDPNVTTDQFIYHHEITGQPIVFLAHSSLVPAGETVLTRSQTQELGVALSTIHQYFLDVYGPATPEHFYAMDVEFKFDDKDVGPGEPPELFIKQARPYPGRGQ